MVKNSKYLTLAIESTGNAAFVDTGRNQEIARIITEAAEKLSEGESDFPLRDLNGNTVGRVSTSTNKQEVIGAVGLVFEFDDEALDGAARALESVAGQVSEGHSSFLIRDDNGNTIGYYQCAESLDLVVEGGVVNIAEALRQNRVYLADSGYSGIAYDAYHYAVTADPDVSDLQCMNQDQIEVLLVDANGNLDGADSYFVREDSLTKLGVEVRQALEDFSALRISYEEHERIVSGDENSLGM